jgi:hypothetical protein
MTHEPPGKRDYIRIVCGLQGHEIVQEISTNGLEQKLVELETLTSDPAKAILLRGTSDGVSYMTRAACRFLASGREGDVILACVWILLHDPARRGWEGLEHMGGWAFRMDAMLDFGWRVQSLPLWQYRQPGKG